MINSPCFRITKSNLPPMWSFSVCSNMNKVPPESTSHSRENKR